MKDSGFIFIDTNILVYSIYGTTEQKEKIERLLKDQAPTTTLVISMQVLKEFTNVSFKRKLHKTTKELVQHLTKTKRSFTVSEITAETIFDAISLNDQYHYSFYDSLIIATALENKCDTLYSEDMQDGQLIRKKLKIVNPFK